MSTSSSDLIIKHLASFGFWSNLTKKEQTELIDAALIRNYKQGSLIYSREQECLGLIAVISGSLRTFMLSEEGREIQLYQVSAGDCDVLSASCVLNRISFRTHMIAQTDCTLLVIPAFHLVNFKEHNLHIRCFLYEKLGERFSNVMCQMQLILFARVDHRIADMLTNKLKNSKNNSIRITHEQIAMEINSTREVVSRILKDFEHRGIIKLGRGKITVIKSLDTLF